MATYRIGWACDGHGEKTIDTELTEAEAKLWLERCAGKCNQPVLQQPDDIGGWIVNESAEENCGFYFATPEDSGLTSTPKGE